MSVIERLGQVVRSEWSSRFHRDDELGGKPGKEDVEEVEAALKKQSSTPLKPPRAAAVSDVEGALRVLELQGSPTLDEVRARYRELARRYHPKTRSDKADEQNAAHVVLEALTDALEVLEEHLLPLPPLPTK
jgi:DnaJ-domain-containing protein 1